MPEGKIPLAFLKYFSLSVVYKYKRQENEEVSEENTRLVK